MSGKTAGQQACIAWNAAYGEQYGIEARNEWAASDPRGRAAWEAAATAVETEQVRLAREDRDSLKRRVLDLAADLDGRCATRPPGQSHTEHEIAIELRHAAEPPS